MSILFKLKCSVVKNQRALVPEGALPRQRFKVFSAGGMYLNNSRVNFTVKLYLSKFEIPLCSSMQQNIDTLRWYTK